jgi:hypothetical protein
MSDILVTDVLKVIGVLFALIGVPVATYAIRQIYWAKTLESKTRDGTEVGCPLALLVFGIMVFVLNHCIGH